MPIHDTRRIACWLTAVCLVNLIFASCGTQAVRAQSLTGDSDAVVEVPIHQLNQIQEELRYLRERDAQRQAWEESVVKRLPATKFSLASESYVSGDDADLVSPLFEETQKSGCGDKSCGCCCGCYPCQCPLTPAPCIDCPHVSTAKPYFNIHVFGALKLDMLFSGARAISPGTPFFLLPDSPIGLGEDTLDINARQSTLGAALTGPQIGRFQSGGLVVAMFYNDAVVVDQYGLLPLQAYGELRNENWRFAAGLQFDVFSPAAPTVLPFSALCGSGNAGNSFRGQVRLERFLHPADHTQWTLQFALSEPIVSTIDPAFRVSEDNGWPNVEGRIALGLGCPEGAGPAAKRPLEIGLSGVVGQIRTTEPLVRQVVADVWGVSADFRWKMTDCFGIMGEVFTGQTLGTYNGGILQNISFDGVPATFDTLEGVRSSGGWLEVFVYWTPCLHSHTGYGIDDPVNGDVAPGGRIRNSTFYGNLLWDLNDTFRVGFEFTWRETDYNTVLDNEGAGFHTQFAWNF